MTGIQKERWARTSPLLELAGQVVGNYTLERTLGAGGTGTVWLDPQSSGFVGEALLLKAQSERGAGDATAVGLAREALAHLRENVGSDHPSARAALKLAEDAL